MTSAVSAYLPVNPFPHLLTIVQDARGAFTAATELANPMRPMVYPLQPVDFSPALAEAKRGLELIDSAYDVEGLRMSVGIRSALANATKDAQSGITMIHQRSLLPQQPALVAGRFDSAANWLGIAENLVRVSLGSPELHA